MQQKECDSAIAETVQGSGDQLQIWDDAAIATHDLSQPVAVYEIFPRGSGSLVSVPELVKDLLRPESSFSDYRYRTILLLHPTIHCKICCCLWHLL